MESIDTIPFPDVSVRMGFGIGKWRTIAHFLTKADQSGTGILDLFDKVPRLKAAFRKRLDNAALYRLGYDKWENSYNVQDICFKLRESQLLEIGFVCSNTSVKDILVSVTREYNPKTAEMSNILEFLDPELVLEHINDISDESLEKLLVKLVTYSNMKTDDMISFLTEAMGTRTIDFRDMANETERKAIFEYISNQSSKISDFNGLPIPVGVVLTTARGYFVCHFEDLIHFLPFQDTRSV